MTQSPLEFASGGCLDGTYAIVNALIQQNEFNSWADRYYATTIICRVIQQFGNVLSPDNAMQTLNILMSESDMHDPTDFNQWLAMLSCFDLLASRVIVWGMEVDSGVVESWVDFVGSGLMPRKAQTNLYLAAFRRIGESRELGDRLLPVITALDQNPDSLISVAPFVPVKATKCNQCLCLLKSIPASPIFE
jgi:hypothetical protein